MPRAVVRWYSSTTHAAVGVDLDAGLLGVEQVAVGHPARRDQQHVAAHGRAVVAVRPRPVRRVRSIDDVLWLRISHFLAAMSVNAHQIVSSWPRSSVLPRTTIVTRTPSAENTCANSAATNPPPTITRCSGNSGIRMIVSLV